MSEDNLPYDPKPSPLDLKLMGRIAAKRAAAVAPPPTNPAPPEREKQKTAKKIKLFIGPFKTSCTTFERGTREIEIVKVTPLAIIYRLKGRQEEYTLPHETAFQKAVAIQAGLDTGPRSGRIKRGTV
jgi:hypothetical protein